MKSQPRLDQYLLGAAQELLAAQTQESFFLLLSRYQQELLSKLSDSGRARLEPKQLDKHIISAFTAVGTHQRSRRALEALLWPSTSMVPMPIVAGVLPEFAWMFTLPVRLTFSVEQLSTSIWLHGDIVQLEDLLPQLEASGAVSDKAILSGFSSLYRREDFYSSGPLELPRSFLRAETEEGFEPPAPLPIILDEELEGNRVVTTHVLLAACLPLGEQVVLNSKALPLALGKVLASSLRAQLEARGYRLDAVEVDGLAFVAEAYLHSGGPGMRELAAHLDVLKATYGSDIELIGRIPASGYFEINVKTNSGKELIGIPAFSTLEPPAVLRTVLEKLGDRAGLKVMEVTSADATMQRLPLVH